MYIKYPYYCISHIGRCRNSNQDNYICNGVFRKNSEDAEYITENGVLKDSGVLGIFDGLGGEQMGDMAALIAAREASKIVLNSDIEKTLYEYCFQANDRICEFAQVNNVKSMGTTAALLAVTDKEAAICNIGDTRIFRCSDNSSIEQLTVDHLLDTFPGRKPPLTQNLGIPETEMVIEPYTAIITINPGDCFLICSDGLTDMVSLNEIENIIRNTSFEIISEALLNKALENGGKDNVTIIMARCEEYA